MIYRWNDSKNPQYVNDLGHQLQKVIRGWNECHIATRWRYIHASERFIRFVAEKYHLQKIVNIQDKHLEGYAKHLQESRKADSYIKTELAGIRYMHRHIPNTRFELMDGQEQNKKLSLGATPNITDVDRKWSLKELGDMQVIACRIGRYDIARFIEVVFYTGMRLDEAASCRRSDFERATREGILHLVNTKGGRPRRIKLTAKAMDCIRISLEYCHRGEYVFCAKKPVHVFKKEVQNFVYKYRATIQDTDRKSNAQSCKSGERSPLTVHGLRHSNAQMTFDDVIAAGADEKEARKITAEHLGHGRTSITNVYLGTRR